MDFVRAMNIEQRNHRRNEIARVTVSLYMKEGYKALKYSKIAEELSINRTVIYSYFKNVDDILVYFLCKKLTYISDELLNNLNTNINPFVFVAEKIEEDHELIKIISILNPILIPECDIKRVTDYQTTLKRFRDIMGIIYSEYTDEYELDSFLIKFQLFSTLLTGLSSFQASNLSGKETNNLIIYNENDMKMSKIIAEKCN